MSRSDPRTRAVRLLKRASGPLSRAATARIEAEMPWFDELTAEERSWVGTMVQAGVRGFVDWYAEAGDPTAEGAELAASVFGAAPRALAGVITLRQTVELVRLTIQVVEQNVDDFLDPETAPDVHASVLGYGREFAFATAEVYARAAEVRGAWDARLEALVVDSVLRAEPDDSVLSRASAVGWGARGDVAVVLGVAPEGRTETGVFEAVRRAARGLGMDALCAVQVHLMVVLLGGVTEPEKAAVAVADLFGDGPVVVGPVVSDLGHAHQSAAAARSGLRAVAGWPGAPRPVRSEDLLPERILAGDPLAQQEAIDHLYRPLTRSRGALVDTLAAYLTNGGAIEATARELFVHANTVRYRLGQIADLTGHTPMSPRHALALHLALILGRQADAGAANGT